MGVMFTVSRGQVFNFFIHRNLLMAIVSQILCTALVIYLLVSLSRQKKREKTSGSVQVNGRNPGHRYTGERLAR
jgi:hypothetical protein